jgi:hypothetical protein
MVQTNNKVTEEYWDEIIKEVIGEKKEPMFTNEIWEKMKDDYGYPENKETIEIKLFNLLREGYIKSVLRRKKQAWMFPSGTELLSLTETKTIDATIAQLFEQLLRVPSFEEVKTEIKRDPRSSADDRHINERLKQASHLLNAIDHAIKEFPEEEFKKTGSKKMFLPSDELIINRLGESIENFDVSIIELFIGTQKKGIYQDEKSH